jgi:hypothetical protein
MTDSWETPKEQDVSFGPRDDDAMPVSWAAKGLTWLKANRPQQFADMMTEGVFGIEKTRRGRGAS